MAKRKRVEAVKAWGRDNGRLSPSTDSEASLAGARCRGNQIVVRVRIIRESDYRRLTAKGKRK